MGTVHSFPCPDSLDSEAALIAGSAFEAAVRLLDGQGQDEAIRERLAKYIVERAFRGERDVGRLRDEALARLGLASASGGSPNT